MIFNQSGSVEIDSLKLRIPAELVQINSPELLSRSGSIYVPDIDTGEMHYLRDIELNSVKYKDDEYTTTYSIKRMRHDSANTEVECMLIGLGAKLNKSFYYDGMTEKHLEYTLNNLEAQRIITIHDRSLFIEHARCTDIDLKQDRVGISIDQWEQEKEMAKTLTKESKKKGRGYVTFKGQGIQWSERNASQTSISNPLLKMYPKRPDFEGKSKPFADRYLGNITKDVYRTEGTLKNNRDLNSYGIEKTLIGLLRTPQAKLNNTLHKIVCKHIELNPELNYKESKNTSLTDQQDFELGYIEVIMHANECTFDTAMDILCFKHGYSGDKAKNKKRYWRSAMKIKTASQWKEFRSRYAA